MSRIMRSMKDETLEDILSASRDDLVHDNSDYYEGFLDALFTLKKVYDVEKQNSTMLNLVILEVLNVGVEKNQYSLSEYDYWKSRFEREKVNE